MTKTTYLDEENGLILRTGIPDMKNLKISKIVRRGNSPLFNSFMRVGSTLKNPELDFDSRMATHIVLDNDIYYNEQEFEELKKHMIEKAKADPNFLDRYFKKALTDSHNIVLWAKKNAKNTNLKTTYKEFCTKSLKLMSHLWPTLGPEEWILKEIETRLAMYISPKRDFNTYNHVLTLLISSTKDSDAVARKKAMLTGKNLKKTQEKYAWIYDQTLSRIYEDPEDFNIELKTFKEPKKELQKLIDEKKMLIKEQKSVIKKFKIDKKTLKFCSFAQALAHIRLSRRDCLIEAVYHMKKFFDKLQKVVPLKNITLAYYWELQDLLDGKKINLATIEARKDTYNFILIGPHFYDYNSITGEKIKKEIESKLDLNGEIKGQTAAMGIVKGRAIVLFSPKEISKVQRGDILVTSMTTPDYVPAMERAAAFVTDEGGLSCHAAIIAREMKKPCVIGTKIATKVLKDGDIIEVDANQGKVKIIQKKK